MSLQNKVLGKLVVLPWRNVISDLFAIVKEFWHRGDETRQTFFGYVLSHELIEFLTVILEVGESSGLKVVDVVEVGFVGNLFFDVH